MLRRASWGDHYKAADYAIHDSPEAYRTHLGRYIDPFSSQVLLMFCLRPLHRNAQARYYVSQ
jgi:hypothetical protein